MRLWRQLWRANVPLVRENESPANGLPQRTEISIGGNCNQGAGNMTLDSIIERLEKAESGDRELDLTIMNLLAPRAEDEKHFVMGKLLGAKWGAYGHMANQIEYFIEAPKITASVDAAIELAEKVLPGWEDCHGRLIWTHGLKGERIWTADIRYWRSSANHPIAAIALCLAILKAKQRGVGE
jgi:hypothetical protein